MRLYGKSKAYSRIRITNASVKGRGKQNFLLKKHWILSKGTSINDVSPKGEGWGGVQKMPQKEMFTSRFEETRGGRVPQKSKIWGDVVYGWSLRVLLCFVVTTIFLTRKVAKMFKSTQKYPWK